MVKPNRTFSKALQDKSGFPAPDSLSPERGSASPDPGASSPEHKPASSDPGPLSTEHEPTSSDPGPLSSGHEPTSFDPGPLSSGHEPTSPDTRSPSTEHQPAAFHPASSSPEHEPASPDPGASSPEHEPASPDPGFSSPEHEPATPATWESMLRAAASEHWDEMAFAQRVRACGLPALPPGVPVLVRCQAWHPHIPLILHNFLPHTAVFWLEGPEIFLYASPEGNPEASRKKLLPWAAALISQIHSMLADELGVLAHVYVDMPGSRGLWTSYLVLRRLAFLHRRFFPGEAGLAQWQAGFAELFAQSPSEPLEKFSRTVLGQLSPELRETLQTYFRSGLSLTESARLLYIHRNTLIYRLDRITELTGYNPREFNQAVSLFLAVFLMG